MLADYERVLRRSAERIIRMAERPLEMGEAQMRHRHQLETTVIRSDIRRSWAGLAVAALLSLVVLGGGIYLAYRGRQAAGLGSVLAGAAALAAVFFKAKSSRDNMTQPEPANPRRR
ncbi:MAG: DUF2335 domain-containing protein [Acidimicrobiales bacterium]